MVFYYCQTTVFISCWVELWIIIFLRFNLELEYDRDAFCGDTERLIVICLRKNSVSPFFRVFPTFSATHLSRCCCFFSPRSFSSFSRRKLITQHSTATAHLLGWDYYIIFCVFFFFFLHFCAHHRHTPAGESRHSNITGFVQKIHVESTIFTSWFPSKSDAESETRSASKSTIITVCESAKNGAQWNHSLEWVSEMMMGGEESWALVSDNDFIFVQLEREFSSSFSAFCFLSD